MQIKHGFSLIELLVVIALVGILTAIGVPFFTQYVIKSRVLIAYNLMQNIANTQAIAFGKQGTWPATITVNGVTGGHSWFTVNNYQNIYALIYRDAGDGKGAYFGVAVSGLQWMPGYTPPDSDPLGSFSHYQTIYYGLREINGTIVVKCGSLTPGDNGNIPAPYLPNACSCNNINAFAQNGNNC